MSYRQDIGNLPKLSSLVWHRPKCFTSDLNACDKCKFCLLRHPIKLKPIFLPLTPSWIQVAKSNEWNQDLEMDGELSWFSGWCQKPCKCQPLIAELFPQGDTSIAQYYVYYMNNKDHWVINQDDTLLRLMEEHGERGERDWWNSCLAEFRV